MIGRRRRPLLGAAVVGGVSGAVAKREIQAHSQQQEAAQTAEKLTRSEDERQKAEKRYAEDRAAWEKEKTQAQNVNVGKPTNVSGQRYCPNCGKSHVAGANFCGSCGIKLSD